MIQHGIKLITITSIILLSSCNHKNENPDAAFKYCSKVFIGDMIFENSQILKAGIENQLQACLEKIGTLSTNQSKTSDSEALLLVGISPVFVNQAYSSQTLNNLIEVKLQLVTQAQLSKDKTINVKATIWEKTTFINSSSNDIQTEIYKILDDQFLELGKHYKAAHTTPVFFL